MNDINNMIRGKALAPIERNSLPCTFRQCRAIKGLVVCYVVWLGSIKGMGLRTCEIYACLVPNCGQDGYRAQITQHPIET